MYTWVPGLWQSCYNSMLSVYGLNTIVFVYRYMYIHVIVYIDSSIELGSTCTCTVILPTCTYMYIMYVHVIRIQNGVLYIMHRSGYVKMLEKLSSLNIIIKSFAIQL